MKGNKMAFGTEYLRHEYRRHYKVFGKTSSGKIVFLGWVKDDEKFPRQDAMDLAMTAIDQPDSAWAFQADRETGEKTGRMINLWG
jgi:hypothetical protein